MRLVYDNADTFVRRHFSFFSCVFRLLQGQFAAIVTQSCYSLLNWFDWSYLLIDFSRIVSQLQLIYLFTYEVASAYDIAYNHNGIRIEVIDWSTLPNRNTREIISSD